MGASVGHVEVPTLEIGGRAWLSFSAVGFGAPIKSDIALMWCHAKRMHVPLVVETSLSLNHSQVRVPPSLAIEFELMWLDVSRPSEELVSLFGTDRSVKFD